MAKYVAKATVWLQIESTYPDGVGECQREVEQLIGHMKNHYAMGPDGCEISAARATDIDILGGELVEFKTECTDGLTWIDHNNVDHLIDDGGR
jgi:hypothetical protein